MNWNDEKLIRSSSILFSCRELESSYNSLREKIYFKQGLDLKKFFSIKSKKSCLYWLESYRRISKQVEPYIELNNFIVVPLKNLQSNPEGVLKKICTFLNIEPHSNLYDLTTFGIPCSGNANQSNLNTGKIASTTSKISIPLCSFEKRMFNSLSLYDFTKLKKRSFVPFRLIEMLKLAYTNAFFELPADKIWIKNKYSPFQNFLGRMYIFFNICAIYFIMKNERLTLAFIRKRNKHIENMPIWNERV